MDFGPYQVTGEIGRGGMGAVFRGRAPDGRDVAIKLLLATNARAGVERFDRERRLLSSLGESSGFVPLLDAGSGGSGPYLVMPFVSGGTLRDRLRTGPLPTDEAVTLVRAIAESVGRAHARGIVHRDLKPENVLFTADGRPLVADLGLAKHFDPDAPGASGSHALSKTGDFRGTIGYMAPEQMGKAKDAAPPADVFALGAILYECVAGVPAFTGDGVHVVLARVANGKYTPLARATPGTPAWLSGVVARALDPDPARRFRDGAEIAEALARGPSLAIARPRALVALAVVAALVAGSAIAVAFHRASRAPVVPPAPAPTPVAPAEPERAPVKPGAPEIPRWWVVLPEHEKPALPLPRGVAFGGAPGEYVNQADGSVLVYVPLSRFRMGSEGREYEQLHDVELSPYFLGKREVTVAQFTRFSQTTGYVTTAESEKSGVLALPQGKETMAGLDFRKPMPGKPALDDHPVTQVSHGDVLAYCRWAGLRLPTEAEWERAAGWDAATRHARRYAWGDAEPSPGGPKVGNLADETIHATPEWSKADVFRGYVDGWLTTAPVGSFPAGASPVGALDMTGNVAEWCQDGFDRSFYDKSRRQDPCFETDLGAGYVIRGGSFGSTPEGSRVAKRDYGLAEYRAHDLGFRVARNWR
jgi:serine/threonine-protein kinase